MAEQHRVGKMNQMFEKRLRIMQFKSPERASSPPACVVNSPAIEVTSPYPTSRQPPSCTQTSNRPSSNNILPSTSNNNNNNNNNILPSTSTSNNNNILPSTTTSNPSKHVTFFNFDEISPTTAWHLQRYGAESDNTSTNQENISSVFMGWTRDICHNSADNHSPQKNIYSDRFIPMRQGNNWDTKFAMITEEVTFQENTRVGTTPKKSRESDGNRDGVAYSCLLKNELLGTEIDDVKAQSDERKAFGPVESNNLFKFTSPKKNFLPVEGSSPYSLYPVSSLYPVTSKSQKLLRSPRKATRKISRIPFKVLDAPELQDDFYLNLVDWSSQNVLSVGLGSCVYLWSACTSQVTRLCDLSSDGNSVTAVSWNERGNLVAVGTHHGYVQVWDVVANKQVNKLQGHSARVGALAWNGEVLSSGSRDRLILQRDVRTPSILPERKLAGHRQEVCGLKWSPDNQYLASGGNDNRLYVWNLHSLAPVQTYTEHLAAVKAIAWSPHHHGLLASGGGTADRCIRFWNTLTGQPMQCVDTGSQVCNLAWSKHSSELVSTHGYSQNQILVWKYPSLSQVAKLTGHSYRVLYLAMSPDGEAIVTGAGDETLRFWNVFSKARSQKGFEECMRSDRPEEPREMLQPEQEECDTDETHTPPAFFLPELDLNWPNFSISPLDLAKLELMYCKSSSSDSLSTCQTQECVPLTTESPPLTPSSATLAPDLLPKVSLPVTQTSNLLSLASPRDIVITEEVWILPPYPESESSISTDSDPPTATLVIGADDSDFFLPAWLFELPGIPYPPPLSPIGADDSDSFLPAWLFELPGIPYSPPLSPQSNLIPGSWGHIPSPNIPIPSLNIPIPVGGDGPGLDTDTAFEITGPQGDSEHVPDSPGSSTSSSPTWSTYTWSFHSSDSLPSE